MRKPRPLPAKNPGLKAGPTPLMRGDTNREPFAVHIAHMGGTAAKSAGHAAHDAIHVGRKVVKKLNPFD